MRVLFPLDGSEPAYQAMQKAIRLMPAQTQIEATVLVVLQDFKGAPEDIRDLFGSDGLEEIFPTPDSAQNVFREIKRRLGSLHAKVTYMMAQGNARREILAAARDHDLLVMHATSHGGRRARGSHRLARKAPCAVLLV